MHACSDQESLQDPFSSIGYTMITLINLGAGLSHYDYAMTCKNGYVLSSVLCTIYYLLYLATVLLLLMNLLTGGLCNVLCYTMCYVTHICCVISVRRGAVEYLPVLSGAADGLLVHEGQKGTCMQP